MGWFGVGGGGGEEKEPLVDEVEEGLCAGSRALLEVGATRAAGVWYATELSWGKVIYLFGRVWVIVEMGE